MPYVYSIWRFSCARICGLFLPDCSLPFGFVRFIIILGNCAVGFILAMRFELQHVIHHLMYRKKTRKRAECVCVREGLDSFRPT